MDQNRIKFCELYYLICFLNSIDFYVRTRVLGRVLKLIFIFWQFFLKWIRFFFINQVSCSNFWFERFRIQTSQFDYFNHTHNLCDRFVSTELFNSSTVLSLAFSSMRSFLKVFFKEIFISSQFKDSKKSKKFKTNYFSIECFNFKSRLTFDALCVWCKKAEKFLDKIPSLDKFLIWTELRANKEYCK